MHCAETKVLVWVQVICPRNGSKGDEARIFLKYEKKNSFREVWWGLLNWEKNRCAYPYDTVGGDSCKTRAAARWSILITRPGARSSERLSFTFTLPPEDIKTKETWFMYATLYLNKRENIILLRNLNFHYI